MKIKLSIKEVLDWKNIRLNLLICTGIAILMTTILYLQYQGSLIKIFLHTAIYSYSIGYSIYSVMTAISMETRQIIWIYTVFVVKLITGSILGILAAKTIFAIIYGVKAFSINSPQSISLIITGVIFGLAAITIFYFFHLYEERKYKHLQEKEKKTRAELRALVSQINPHFLFNTLNTISSLIHIDPDGADEMLMKLSDVFRYSLRSGNKRFVSIADELRIVGYYLQIEKVRFSDRLNYRIDIDDSCLSYALPPLILQTLVENSVKHGISPKVEGGEVYVSVQNEKDLIVIRIEDNGVGMADIDTKGFGLDAVRNILQLQYKKAHFELKNENGVKIKLMFPKVSLQDEI